MLSAALIHDYHTVVSVITLSYPKDSTDTYTKPSSMSFSKHRQLSFCYTVAIKYCLSLSSLLSSLGTHGCRICRASWQVTPPAGQELLLHVFGFCHPLLIYSQVVVPAMCNTRNVSTLPSASWVLMFLLQASSVQSAFCFDVSKPNFFFSQRVPFLVHHLYIVRLNDVVYSCCHLNNLITPLKSSSHRLQSCLEPLLQLLQFAGGGGWRAAPEIVHRRLSSC